MPKVKPLSTLSGLVDSDSDDGQFGMPTPDSAAENKMPAKKARGRPKAAPSKPAPTKVTKTKAKAPARRTSGRLEAKAMELDAAPAKTKRPALKDKTNQYAGDEDELDDLDRDVVMEGTVEDSMIAPKTKSKVTKKTATARGTTAKATVQNDSIVEDAPVVTKPKGRAPKKTGPMRKENPVEPSPEKIVQETQYEEMDMDIDADDDEVVEAPVSKPIQSISRTQSHSRQRQPSVQRRRAGSASDTERNDPALRRKLGEITKKYETLNIKYLDLKQIGIKEADRNMDRLKKETDQTTKNGGALIESLKAKLANQEAIVKKNEVLKTKLETQTKEVAALKAQIAKLTASLSEAHSENKTLSTKLAANRTASASVESAHSKTPGSAMKVNGGIRLMGTAEAAQVAQAAQLKEDLYSDLTGLIIRSVKRESEEDIFDCIQTGRNGTLHFKLAAANEKSAESYDDAQCSYIPQLDPSRDKELMELLPDYLVDEITFPRPQAAKFYARVGKALTEKPV
ncbi:chromosome segregation protein Csm1/Pcs1-domain-containing protein [Rhexocercosporidium sp. MPI-PUGE-AT-0058]|nr:chromosome segregation protein Csm1/Pcs1-domain-containing protein [Rhexocercosporidium sp. MPI-PUGE-AT-0058]